MNQPTTHNRSRIRYRILALVFVNVVINYMDRSNISIAGAAIGKELALSPVQLGAVFSAFGWTYTALQIPGGLLADRIGPKVLYAFTLITWSAATLLQGFVKGFGALLGLRLATGAFEAPAFPTNNRIITSWFPDSERASAIALYTSGQFVGLAFLTPALVALQFYLGWRGLFLVTGSVGIIWGVIWYFLYRDPLEHKKVTAAELEYIEKGGGVISRKHNEEKEAKPKFSSLQFAQVFKYKKLWGIYIGQFAVNSTLWFFLTWFPTYLVQYRGFDFLKGGLFASLPFLAAFFGLLLSGFFSDYLVKQNVSLGLARKAPVIIGLLLSISVIGANYTDNKAGIIFFMCLAFFGNGMASIAWVFVSTLAPLPMNDRRQLQSC